MSESEDEKDLSRDCDKTVVIRKDFAFYYEVGAVAVELPAYIQEKKLIVKA